MTDVNKKKGLLSILIIGGGVIVIIALIIIQSGVYKLDRINPGRQENQDVGIKEKELELTETAIPEYYSSVGTVRSREEVEFSPRIIARVVKVNHYSGDSVKKGETLIQLDDIDLKAAVARAKERVKKAEAALELANSNLRRAEKLIGKKVISEKQYDLDLKNKRSAEAELFAAREGLKEAEANFSFATIKSPIDAIVSERFVDPGDLASPGSIMMSIFDPSRLMLYVPVRESLVSRIKVGDKMTFKVAALNKAYEGTVREVVPAVDPGSRTFLVKICIDDSKGLMPGMFGTLKLKLGEEKALLIPKRAIKYVGQLEYVDTLKDGRKIRMLVRTVPSETEGMRKVVSGLKTGETLLVPEKREI